MYGTHLVPSKRRLSLKVLDRLPLQLNEPAANFEWKRYAYLADNENGVVAPTITRVVFHFYVRDLYCCTYSCFDFLPGDWHFDAEGEAVRVMVVIR